MAKTDIRDESLKFLGIGKVLQLFCEGFLSYNSTINEIDTKECEV